MAYDTGIPWHVTLRGKLLWWLWRPAWRGFWVHYWESQDISEEQQMEWAEEMDREE